MGLGGIWIEVLRDVRLLPADIDEAGILRELGRLRAAALLHGARGQPPVNLPAVARAVATIGTIMRTMPSVREIDINPLVADADGVRVLDVLLVCDPA